MSRTEARGNSGSREAVPVYEESWRMVAKSGPGGG
jgi:hypothetical protein